MNPRPDAAARFPVSHSVKRRIAQHAIFWGLAVLAGCSRGSDRDESELQRYEGVEIRILLPAELELTSAWTPAFEDWAADTSASYSVSQLDPADANGEEWLESLRRDPPTVAVLQSTSVTQLIAQGLAAPIPESVLSTDAVHWNQIPASVRKALGTQGNRSIAYPLTSAPLVAFYRRDLLDGGGREVPTTWDGYDQLVGSIEEWAPGHVAIEPRGDDTLATLFLARAAAGGRPPTQYSFELDVSSGDPLIASEPFVRTLERMVELHAHLSDESRTATFMTSLEAARRGDAAIGITALTAQGLLSAPASVEGDAAAENTVDLVFAPLPGSDSIFDRESHSWKNLGEAEMNRPAVCGFAGYSVCVLKSASDVEQAAAWDLLSTLIAVLHEGTVPSLPGIPTHPDMLNTSIRTTAGPMSPTSLGSLEQAILAIYQNQHLIAELPCAGRKALLSSLANSLRQALNGDLPPKDALENTSKDWNSKIEELGRKNVLNSYRQRLGLSTLP